MAEYRDEVWDEVDRGERVGGDADRGRLRIPRDTWITRREIKDLVFKVRGEEGEEY
jgi:hypothetical protein